MSQLGLLFPMIWGSKAPTRKWEKFDPNTKNLRGGKVALEDAEYTVTFHGMASGLQNKLDTWS